MTSHIPNSGKCFSHPNLSNLARPYNLPCLTHTSASFSAFATIFSISVGVGRRLPIGGTFVVFDLVPQGTAFSSSAFLLASFL